ncbi:integral membrane protein [Rutstroemia sp. NJR-2017a BBW]|nr:integral membrane protein [Rutstroemia sp. NJR-2017a BBW]
MVIVILLGIGNIIQCFAICRPFAYQWDKTIEGGTCGNQTLGILLVAILNLITDLIMVIMPMPMVWNLKMPRSKKLALMGMFGLGIMYDFNTCF